VIFVTIGNAIRPFPRLLNAIDHLAARGTWNGERILLQTGYSNSFSTHHCESIPFLPMDTFRSTLEEADVIVSHGGCGTLLNAVRLGKKPVVMPRLKRYGEHVNDHQLQLVAALASEGKIVPAYDSSDLEHAITEAREFAKPAEAAQPAAMLKLLSQAIRELGGKEL
jgi:UDP-N-acetylglucosamine transferase subunit ALG13